MAVMIEMQRRFRQVLFPVIGACVLSYFAYHTVQGDRGLLSYWRVSQEVERVETRLNTLTAEREVQELRVASMRNSRMDLDLLEEQSRETFNVVHPDDILIYLNKSQ